MSQPSWTGLVILTELGMVPMSIDCILGSQNSIPLKIPTCPNHSGKMGRERLIIGFKTLGPLDDWLQTKRGERTGSAWFCLKELRAAGSKNPPGTWRRSALCRSSVLDMWSAPVNRWQAYGGRRLAGKGIDICPAKKKYLTHIFYSEYDVCLQCNWQSFLLDHLPL